MIPTLIVAALFIGVYIYDRRTRPERSRRQRIGAIRRRATTHWMGDKYWSGYDRRNTGGWTNYAAYCELCTHTWVATVPDEAKMIECPNCEHMNDLQTM